MGTIRLLVGLGSSPSCNFMASTSRRDEDTAMARDLDTEFASVVTAALHDDATAGQWMHLTNMWLASSRTALDASSQGGTGERARLDAVHLVEAATRAQSAATINQARTRDALMDALDVLGSGDAAAPDAPDGIPIGYSWTPIAAAGLVQATAIAITAEAHLAAVVRAQTDEAARKAAAAVDAAARTVAHAAEDARTMLEITATLAADQVADTATRAATEMQTRADTLDTSTLAADETRIAAQHVARAVTAAAAVVAATTSATAAATHRDVVSAAAAVRDVAETTARDVASATRRAARTASDAATARTSCS